MNNPHFPLHFPQNLHPQFFPPFHPQHHFPHQAFHHPPAPVKIPHQNRNPSPVHNLPAPQPDPIPPILWEISPPLPVITPADISITDTELPSLGTIPFLKSAADWVSWFATVSRLIAGLRGYICRIPVPGDLIDPTSHAVLPPHYDFDSTPEEAEIFWVFWANDDIADHIIVGKLAPEIANSLPPKRGGPYDMPICMAWDTSTFLKKRFSVGSAVTADLTKDKVFAMTVTAPAQVAAYIEAWRSAVHQLAGSPWDFTPFQSTQKFVNGLLTFGKYVILKEKV
ncbi:hypothetical protein C0992_009819 [Termitomyces sp. T32_za158]|nr:hypothetical protein C0992_009819 [Termitomyces sp. T32_za158]